MLLNDYFGSVFTFDDEVSETQPTPSYHTICLENVSFTVEDVEILLNEVPDSAKVTTDEVPPFILRFASSVLVTSVYISLTSIIYSRVWTDIWKSAIVEIVHKSENKKRVSNYGPVSNLPKLSLVF